MSTAGWAERKKKKRFQLYSGRRLSRVRTQAIIRPYGRRPWRTTGSRREVDRIEQHGRRQRRRRPHPQSMRRQRGHSRRHHMCRRYPARRALAVSTPSGRHENGAIEGVATRGLSRTTRRHNAQRRAAIAMDSRPTRCYASLHRTTPAEIQFFRSQNSTETTTGRVPKNCIRVVTTPMQSRKDAEFADESGFGSVQGPQKGSLRAHTPALSPHDETIARANTAATEN